MALFRLEVMIYILYILEFLLTVVSAHRRSVAGQTANEARMYKEIEQSRRTSMKYEIEFTKLLTGKMTPFEVLANSPTGSPTKKTDWLLGYDGHPFGPCMWITIMLPMLTAKIISLLAEFIRPIPPDMSKAPVLPKIPIYYLQSTPVERELRRPLRSGIVWYAKRFIVRSDDDFIDREHIRHLLKTHQKIYVDASKNPWHTVRVLLRLNQLKKKAQLMPGHHAEKPDQLQSFLDRFTKAMDLNEMHRQEEKENLRRLEEVHKASEINLTNKLVKVQVKQKLEQTKEVADHLDSKVDALLQLRDAAIRAQQLKLEEQKQRLRRQEKLLKWEKKVAAKEERVKLRQQALLKARSERHHSLLELDMEQEDESSSSSSSDTDSDDDNETREAKLLKRKAAEGMSTREAAVEAATAAAKEAVKKAKQPPPKPIHFSRHAKPKAPYVRRDRTKYDPAMNDFKLPVRIHGVYRKLTEEEEAEENS